MSSLYVRIQFVPCSFNSGANSLIPFANRLRVAVKAADPGTWRLQKHAYIISSLCGRLGDTFFTVLLHPPMFPMFEVRILEMAC